MTKYILPISLFTILLVSGCAKKITPKETSVDACVQACRDARAKGTDLSKGPCIYDPIPQLLLASIPDVEWVCDVAHDPRQPVDNLPENQCQTYLSGAAKHFVEVTPDCEIIRSR